ncbi:MAG: FtsH protease activity modulator HflK [Lachnospiraceae bacterium]|nr:FtsH protease activity modulator HflK [Lachnospiraceae bacterium]
MENNRKTENFEQKIPHYSDSRIGDNMKKIVIAIVVVMIAAMVGTTSTYQIREQEQAVLTTFGKARAVTEPGLHFKFPFIQQVEKVNTTIQGFAIGYDVNTNETIPSEAVMITSDYNFIDVDFFIEYKVSDPVKAVYASADPIKILKNLAQSSIRNVIGSYDVDSVLTTGKNEIQASIKEVLNKQLQKHDIGLALVNVTIQDSEPPTVEIMEAFKNVETAKQGKETAINNANKYKNEKLPTAEAEADQIIKEAEAYKQERINEATGQVARFNAMYEEYIKNPTITKQRMFYETMEEVLPDLELIIDSSNGVQKILPLDSFFEMENSKAVSKEEN